MTPLADMWTPHLKPGETLVWSASASADLRKADIKRQRLIHGAVGAGSLLVALMLAARFVESLIIVTAAPSMLAAFTPLYLVFALAMAALSLWGFRKLFASPAPDRHFAATTTRLIALDASGAIVDEMPAAEVDGVLAGGRRLKPDIYVLRRDDPNDARAFAIEHIDRPLEAKAIIEDTYPPEQHAELRE